MARRFPRCDVSPSKIIRFAECARRYHEARQPGAPAERPSEDMLVGSLFHAACEGVTVARLTGARPREAPVEAGELLAALPGGRDDAGREPAPLRARALRRARTLLVAVAPRLDLRRAVAAEEPWELPLASGGVAGGIWDRVDREGGDDGEVNVVDYKTGHPPSRGEVEESPQALLYLAGARARWPRARRVLATFWWVDRDVAYPLEWTPEADLVAREHAEAHLRREAAAVREGAWEAREGVHCASCAFQAGCPGYARLLRAQPADLLPAFDAPADALLRARAWLSGLEKAAEAKRREIDDVLRARVGKAPELVAGGYRAVVRWKPAREPPPAAEAVEVLAAASGQGAADVARAVLGVDRRRLRSWLEGLAPDARAEAVARYEEREVVRDGTSYLEVRALRGPF